MRDRKNEKKKKNRDENGNDSSNNNSSSNGNMSKKSSTGFQSMGFAWQILKGILHSNYKQPTPIQRKVSSQVYS